MNRTSKSVSSGGPTYKGPEPGGWPKTCADQVDSAPSALMVLMSLGAHFLAIALSVDCERFEYFDSDDIAPPGAWPATVKEEKDAIEQRAEASEEKQRTETTRDGRRRILNTNVKSDVEMSKLRAPVNAHLRRVRHELKIAHEESSIQGEVLCMALGVNGTEVAIGDDAGGLWIMQCSGDATNSKATALFDPALSNSDDVDVGFAHSGGVLAISYAHANGHALVSSGADGNVRVWTRVNVVDRGEANARKRFDMDDTSIVEDLSVEDGDDDDRPVLDGGTEASVDETLRKLDGTHVILGGNTKSESDGEGGWVEHIATSLGAPLFAAASGRTVQVIALNGNPLVSFGPLANTVNGVTFAGLDGALCASTSSAVLVWACTRPRRNVVTFSPVPREFTWKASWFTSMEPSPSGAWLAGGCGDGQVQLWRRSAGDESADDKLQVACPAGGEPGRKVRFVSWDNTGRYIALTAGHSILVWDVTSSQRSGPVGSTPFDLLTRPSRFSEPPLPLAFAWRPLTMAEWNAFSKQIEATMAGNAFGGIEAPKILAVAFSDGTIKLYDISVYRRGDAIRNLPHVVPSAASMRAVEILGNDKKTALAEAYLTWTGEGSENNPLGLLLSYTDPVDGTGRVVTVSHSVTEPEDLSKLGPAQ